MRIQGLFQTLIHPSGCSRAELARHVVFQPTQQASHVCTDSVDTCSEKRLQRQQDRQQLHKSKAVEERGKKRKHKGKRSSRPSRNQNADQRQRLGEILQPQTNTQRANINWLFYKKISMFHVSQILKEELCINLKDKSKYWADNKNCAEHQFLKSDPPKTFKMIKSWQKLETKGFKRQCKTHKAKETVGPLVFISNQSKYISSTESNYCHLLVTFLFVPELLHCLETDTSFTAAGNKTP